MCNDLQMVECCIHAVMSHEIVIHRGIASGMGRLIKKVYAIVAVSLCTSYDLYLMKTFSFF